MSAHQWAFDMNLMRDGKEYVPGEKEQEEIQKALSDEDACEVTFWMASVMLPYGEYYDDEIEETVKVLVQYAKEHGLTVFGIAKDEDQEDNILFVEDNRQEWISSIIYHLREADDEELIAECRRRGITAG